MSEKTRNESERLALIASHPEACSNDQHVMANLLEDRALFAAKGAQLKGTYEKAIESLSEIILADCGEVSAPLGVQGAGNKVKVRQ